VNVPIAFVPPSPTRLLRFGFRLFQPPFPLHFIAPRSNLFFLLWVPLKVPSPFATLKLASSNCKVQKFFPISVLPPLPFDGPCRNAPPNHFPTLNVNSTFLPTRNWSFPVFFLRVSWTLPSTFFLNSDPHSSNPARTPLPHLCLFFWQMQDATRLQRLGPRSSPVRIFGPSDYLSPFNAVQCPNLSLNTLISSPSSPF